MQGWRYALGAGAGCPWVRGCLEGDSSSRWLSAKWRTSSHAPISIWQALLEGQFHFLQLYMGASYLEHMPSRRKETTFNPKVALETPSLDSWSGFFLVD